MIVKTSGVEGAGPLTVNSAARRQEFEDILPDVLPGLRSVAFRLTRNSQDAEDAVQDAMLSAFKNIAQFNGRAKMSTWLTAIVTNAVYMQMRRRGRRHTLSLDWAPDGLKPVSELLADARETPDRVLERSDLYGVMLDLTHGLPASQQAALRLRYDEDLSIKQAASVLGVPPGTLKAQLSRGRANVAKRFHRAINRTKSKSQRFCCEAGGVAVPQKCAKTRTYN